MLGTSREGAYSKSGTYEVQGTYCYRGAYWNEDAHSVGVLVRIRVLNDQKNVRMVLFREGLLLKRKALN